MAKEGDFWKQIINSLTGPFPEVGQEAPETELIKDSDGINIDVKGNFFRVSMDIYFFLDLESGKYYTMQNQTMHDFGEMDLGAAIELAKKKKKK